MASITTDNARYTEFLGYFTDGVFTANQISYLSSLLAKATQEQYDAKEISNVLTLIMASAEVGTDFLTLTVDDVTEDSVVINSTAHTIAIGVPALTDPSTLVFTFTLSDGAICTVGGTAQVSGTTENDFTSPVVYNVLAQDKTTSQNWTITVTVAT
jgi:hypothetical protein